MGALCGVLLSLQRRSFVRWRRIRWRTIVACVKYAGFPARWLNLKDESNIWLRPLKICHANLVHPGLAVDSTRRSLLE